MTRELVVLVDLLVSKQVESVLLLFVSFAKWAHRFPDSLPSTPMKVLSIHLTIYLSIYPSSHPSIHFDLSIYLYISISISFCDFIERSKKKKRPSWKTGAGKLMAESRLFFFPPHFLSFRLRHFPFECQRQNQNKKKIGR